jgi:putative hydrolase of HD superfamily
MITYALAAKLFGGFSILRWNDRLRPTELVEIEHHALKSILTYFLGKTVEHSSTNKTTFWREIVDGNIYDLLGKITTSDIQTEVRQKLKKTAGEDFVKLIVEDWNKPALGIKKSQNFEKYIGATVGAEAIKFPILRFAHKYVTRCEFEIIKKFSLDTIDNRRIENEINSSIKKSLNSSLEKIAEELENDDSDILSVFRIIERLRYQIRWSQTPRIPSTSVLGHCMYCAVLAYFISVEAGLESDRIVNNFYAALFHDMPEALSRDIISPVKKAAIKIEEQIAQIERELCEDRILKKIPEVWKADFRFITGQMCYKGENNLIDTQLDTTKYNANDQREEFKKHGEFSNRIKVTDNPTYEIIPWGNEIMDSYRSKYGVDGELLKICDLISSYMEARMSMQHGIRSPHLDNGIAYTTNACRGKHLYNINVDDFFDSITF